MVLGGIHIPNPVGLEGHSDADAVAHAITDALLGAAALGDIGTHFPPTDERWRGADSMDLLQRAVSVLREHGFTPINVDATVVCEAPKIGPHVPAMREKLAAALGIEVVSVSVKGKTNEGMGWIGRGEGIAVMAVATVRQGG